jgi:hypothetical protein
MAASRKPDIIAGLNESQAQVLRQAGVDTVEKLAAIDPEALAGRTGLGVEELRSLKAQAAAAQRCVAARPVRRSMTIAWVMLALVVIAVIAVLYAIRARAGAQALVAEQEQKLRAATARVASIAQGRVDAAASEVANHNWGEAQRDLNQAGEEITFLERIAPRALRRGVEEARSRLGRAQEAVGRQDSSAAQRINDLKQAISNLSGDTG